MAEGKNQIKVFLVLTLIMFLTGLGLGYYWEYQRQKPTDYKKLLQDTITYIATLEEKNQEMVKQTGALQNDIAALKKQQGIPESNQLARLNERVAVLEKENIDLKTAAGRSEALAQENQELRQKIQSLVESINTRGGSVPVQESGKAGY